MSKITLSMSKETNEKLKALAKDDERSLSKYLERGLIYLANIPGGYHTIISTPTYTPMYIPHDTPGGISTPPVIEPYKIICNTTPEGSAPAQSTPEPKPEPDNEWYKKIKKGYRTLYGENSPEWQELLHMAAHPDVKAFMKTQHRNDVEQIITNSYEHTLDIYEFEELLDYLNRGPRCPQQIKKI